MLMLFCGLENIAVSELHVVEQKVLTTNKQELKYWRRHDCHSNHLAGRQVGWQTGEAPKDASVWFGARLVRGRP